MLGNRLASDGVGPLWRRGGFTRFTNCRLEKENWAKKMKAVGYGVSVASSLLTTRGRTFLVLGTKDNHFYVARSGLKASPWPDGGHCIDHASIEGHDGGKRLRVSF